jgi:hypothetical protein
MLKEYPPPPDICATNQGISICFLFNHNPGKIAGVAQNAKVFQLDPWVGIIGDGSNALHFWAWVCPGKASYPSSLKGTLPLRRLQELHRVSRQVLPALGHLPARAGHAALYPGVRPDQPGAAATLKDLLAPRPGFVDGHLLLAKIYVEQGERPQAETMLRQAQQAESLSPRDRARVAEALQKLNDSQSSKDNHSDKQ